MFVHGLAERHAEPHPLQTMGSEPTEAALTLPFLDPWMWTSWLFPGGNWPAMSQDLPLSCLAPLPGARCKVESIRLVNIKRDPDNKRRKRWVTEIHYYKNINWFNRYQRAFFARTYGPIELRALRRMRDAGEPLPPKPHIATLCSPICWIGWRHATGAAACSARILASATRAGRPAAATVFSSPSAWLSGAPRLGRLCPPRACERLCPSPASTSLLAHGSFCSPGRHG